MFLRQKNTAYKKSEWNFKHLPRVSMITSEQTLSSFFVILPSTYIIFLFARNYPSKSFLKNVWFQNVGNFLESCSNLPLPGMLWSEVIWGTLVFIEMGYNHTRFLHHFHCNSGWLLIETTVNNSFSVIYLLFLFSHGMTDFRNDQ